MKVLLVLSHPRRRSLTGRVADDFAGVLAEAGHEVEWADLVAEGFDPVLRPADEPDWDDADKRYSDVVHREMDRIARNDATVMVFPVYWWSMPAMMKGWVDRVWNHGWAYGSRNLPQRRVWMIAVAGVERAQFSKRGYDAAMETQLGVGMLDYCRIAERRFEILYGSLEGDDAVTALLAEARRLAGEF